MCKLGLLARSQLNLWSVTKNEFDYEKFTYHWQMTLMDHFGLCMKVKHFNIT